MYLHIGVETGASIEVGIIAKSSEVTGRAISTVLLALPTVSVRAASPAEFYTHNKYTFLIPRPLSSRHIFRTYYQEYITP